MASHKDTDQSVTGIVFRSLRYDMEEPVLECPDLKKNQICLATGSPEPAKPDCIESDQAGALERGPGKEVATSTR